MKTPYSGKNALSTLMTIIKKALAGKLDTTALVADLTSTDDGAPLAASQGNVLKGMIDDQKTAFDTALEDVIPSSEKGAASGVAPLGEDGVVPSTYLPSYVDDVIDMSYTPSENEGEDGTWYVVDPDEGKTTTEVQFVKGKIFLDVDNNISYRWSGTALVDITSPDMEELTPEEIQAMWDGIVIDDGTTDDPEQTESNE